MRHAIAAEAAPTTLRSGVAREAANCFVGADLSAIEGLVTSRYCRRVPDLSMEDWK